MDDRTPLSFDTETHAFGPGNHSPRIVCSSVDMGAGPALLDRNGTAQWLREALPLVIEGKAVIVGNNIAYDFACVIAECNFPELAPLVWQAYDALGIHCLRVRELLLDMARGSRFEEDDEDEGDEDSDAPARKPQRKVYSLDRMAASRCDIILNKTGPWRTSYKALDGVPIAQWDPGAIEYALEDGRAGRAVWIDQERSVANSGYARRWNEVWIPEVGRQSAFSFALQLMRSWGIAVDPERVRALRARLEPRLIETSGTMREAGLMRPKMNKKGKYPRNMAAIRELIAKTYKGDGHPPLSPKTKQISTKRAVLELCDHPALVAAVDYAHTEKLLSAFVSKLEAAGNGRIHASTDVLGANTGRMSCRDPNLHQQPREPGVRECFKASPGYVLIACDFDGQEVRGMGEVREIKLGHSTLAQRYRDDPDFDPHTYFTTQVLGMSYEQGLALKAARDKKFDDDRQIFKSANLGFMYGMGPPKFMAYARGYGVTIDFETSKQLYSQYRIVWPDAREFFNLLSSLTERGSITVEVPYVGRLRGECSYTQVGNTWVQGLCSDITKSAVWEVTKRCYGAPGTEGSALYGCRPLNVPHDEIVIEAPEEYAHEAAVELEQVMVAAQQELTPHVPARATSALMYWWSKGAKSSKDASGRYIPWERSEAYAKKMAKEKAA